MVRPLIRRRRGRGRGVEADRVGGLRGQGKLLLTGQGWGQDNGGRRRQRGVHAARLGGRDERGEVGRRLQLVRVLAAPALQTVLDRRLQLLLSLSRGFVDGTERRLLGRRRRRRRGSRCHFFEEERVPDWPLHPSITLALSL